MNQSIRTQGTPSDLARRSGGVQPVFEARAGAGRGENVHGAPSVSAEQDELPGEADETPEDLSATEVHKEACRYCW